MINCGMGLSVLNMLFYGNGVPHFTTGNQQHCKFQVLSLCAHHGRAKNASSLLHEDPHIKGALLRTRRIIFSSFELPFSSLFFFKHWVVCRRYLSLLSTTALTDSSALVCWFFSLFHDPVIVVNASVAFFTIFHLTRRSLQTHNLFATTLSRTSHL